MGALNTGDVIADLINRPPHYNRYGGIECIEAIQAMLGDTGFISYCQGNILKYVWRWKHKGAEADLRKADWYLSRMLEAVEALEARSGGDA